MTSNATAMAPDVATRRTRPAEIASGPQFSEALTQANNPEKATKPYRAPQRPEDIIPGAVAENPQILPTANDVAYTDYRRFTSADPYAANRADENTAAEGRNFFGEDGLTLGDVVDIVNPLQHIPIVSAVYRYVTGDEISPGAELAGGTLYGGPIGFAGSLANVIMTDQTGDDLGGTALTALFGAPGMTDTGTALADAGAQGSAVQTAQVDPQNLNEITPAAAQAMQEQTAQNGVSPLFAAQPITNAGGQRSGLFASTPVGSPIASVQPILPGQQSMTSGNNPQTSPGTAVAQGVPNLSADAATALMRMAQNSQAQNSHTQATKQTTQSVQASQGAVPIKPLSDPAASSKFISLRNAPVAPTPLPSHSSVTPPPKAETETVAPGRAVTAEAPAPVDRPQTAEFLEPVPSKDLPSAMMDALAKYEKMKSPS
jgi:hypothetical protein